MADSLGVAVVEPVNLEDQDPDGERDETPEDPAERSAPSEERGGDREGDDNPAGVRRRQQAAQDEVSVWPRRTSGCAAGSRSSRITIVGRSGR